MMRWLFILTFLIGLGLGIGGTYFAPHLFGPYLPEMFQRKGELVEGTVVAKQEKAPWLLLTIDTAQGALLATFTNKVDEITLLVEEGDGVELFLRRYEPFVKDPRIKRVQKGESGVATPALSEEAVPAAPQQEEKENKVGEKPDTITEEMESIPPLSPSPPLEAQSGDEESAVNEGGKNEAPAATPPPVEGETAL